MTADDVRAENRRLDTELLAEARAADPAGLHLAPGEEWSLAQLLAHLGEFPRFFAEQLASGGGLVAIDRRSGRIVGSSRFHGYDAARSEVEIGWTFLARSHWGGVYNGEMKALMLRHAFQFVNSVIFIVGRQNFRSQRAVEKISGVLVGSRSDASGRDSLVYEITASTFRAIQS